MAISSYNPHPSSPTSSSSSSSSKSSRSMIQHGANLSPPRRRRSSVRSASGSESSEDFFKLSQSSDVLPEKDISFALLEIKLQDHVLTRDITIVDESRGHIQFRTSAGPHETITATTSTTSTTSTVRHPPIDSSIHVTIRDDGKAIVFSTVVYTVQEELQRPTVVSSSPHRVSYYSLMTKMMKYNTILNKSQKGAQVGMLDGKFIFFRTVSVGCLNNDERFHKTVSEFHVQAIEIRRDFRTKAACSPRASW
eukprot:CAMPEP_0116561244 /NCGR_PEP_ID=MMETSP0397-20121206/11469_1 /TAXON_ID=216820 /ORGANISM="Cyclophora tenuis, Strain ECT3854" /LENGTH=250 /DNA_ID=CAMNT_0004087353 /DNA_START=25 /DNA_END=774 /DNA_ORIENTATION=-